MTRHRAPMDGVVLAVTVLCAIPVAVVAAVFLRQALVPGHGIALVVTALTGGLLVATWGTSPTGFRVEPGRLVVERPFGEIAYPLAGLVEATPFQPRGLTLRVGNGGLFGVTGWYWNRTLGWFRAHGRKVRGAVLLRWADRRVVVMPEDPARLLRDLAGFAVKTGPV